MLVALILGTVLALGALAFVLYPVFFGTRVSVEGRAARTDVDPVTVLREIEFDKATGKLSDADYTTLRATYARQALRQLRATDAPATMPAGDAHEVAEAYVRRMRSRLICESCGPRPEADATWCSSCGRYLPSNCAGCGGEVRESGARFCSRCGEQLAA